MTGYIDIFFFVFLQALEKKRHLLKTVNKCKKAHFECLVRLGLIEVCSTRHNVLYYKMYFVEIFQSSTDILNHNCTSFIVLFL